MAWTFITGGVFGVGTGGGAAGTTSSLNTTGADLLIVVLSYYNFNSELLLSDNKSNSWTNAVNAGPGGAVYGGAVGRVCKLYYCYNPTVGSGHTFTGTNYNAGTWPSIAVAAFSGSASSPLSTSSSSTSNSPGSFTPGQDNCLVVTGIVTDAGTYSSGPTGYTHAGTPVNYVNNAYEGCGLAYKVQTSASAENPSWSMSGAVISSLGAAFKGAAPTGGPFPFHIDSGSMSGGFQSLGFNRLAHKWPHWKTTRRASGLLLAQAG